MFYLKQPFFLMAPDRFQPGFFEKFRLGEERSGTPTSKPPRFHMWCKTLQCFRLKGMVLLCSRCLDKTCQKYRNIKIPLYHRYYYSRKSWFRQFNIVMCLHHCYHDLTLNMTADLCWERNFNSIHELILHIVFLLSRIYQAASCLPLTFKFVYMEFFWAFEFAILCLLSLNSNLKLLSVIKYWNPWKDKYKKTRSKSSCIAFYILHLSFYLFNGAYLRWYK